MGFWIRDRICNWDLRDKDKIVGIIRIRLHTQNPISKKSFTLNLILNFQIENLIFSLIKSALSLQLIRLLPL